MPNVLTEVSPAFLQAFADAWNRHDIDALMGFMADDAFSKLLQAQTFVVPATPAVRPCELASRKSGQPFRMLIGETRAILSLEIEESQSGPHRNTDRWHSRRSPWL